MFSEDFIEFLSAELPEGSEFSIEKSDNNDGKKSTVRYGKSYLKRETPEYKEWRKRNNQSIQECRKKKKLFEQERKEELDKLKQQNSELIKNANQLFEELKCVSKIFKQMNPNDELPVSLEFLNQMSNEINLIKDAMNKI